MPMYTFVVSSAFGKPGGVPYGRFHNPTGKRGSKYATGPVPKYGSPISPADHYGKDPDNFASDWLKIISGDGSHLREQR